MMNSQKEVGMALKKSFFYKFAKVHASSNLETDKDKVQDKKQKEDSQPKNNNSTLEENYPCKWIKTLEEKDKS